MTDSSAVQKKIVEAMAKVALQTHLQYDCLAQCKYAEIPVLSKITEHLGDITQGNCTSAIVRVRNYVHSAIGKGDNYPDPPRLIIPILTAIYRYHAGIRTEGAGIFCCACVCAMAAILHSCGIMSRPVAIYSTASHVSGHLINSHALLEVFNSDSKHWELHDVVYDVGYGMMGREGPISALEFFHAPSAMLRHIPGQKYYPSGEVLVDMHNDLYNNYFKLFTDIIVINYLAHGASVMLNVDAVDMEKRFPGQDNRTILEHLNSVLISPVIIGVSQERMFSLSPLPKETGQG